MRLITIAMGLAMTTPALAAQTDQERAMETAVHLRIAGESCAISTGDEGYRAQAAKGIEQVLANAGFGPEMMDEVQKVTVPAVFHVLDTRERCDQFFRETMPKG